MIARESEAMAKREKEALARVPLFSGLSSRHLKRLADSMQEVRYIEGASVVKEGQEGDSFGELSLLDGGARTATVTTETPMTMLELKRTEFLRMVEDEPDVAVKPLSHTASLLRRTERSLAG